MDGAEPVSFQKIQNFALENTARRLYDCLTVLQKDLKLWAYLASMKTNEAAVENE